jgi:hypothetical protein
MSFTGTHDAIYAGDGNDRLALTFPGVVTIDGGRGNDQIFISFVFSTTAIIYGGDGDDAIFAASNNDRLYGGEGNDLVTGHAALAASRNGLVTPAINEPSGDDVLEGVVETTPFMALTGTTGSMAAMAMIAEPSPCRATASVAAPFPQTRKLRSPAFMAVMATTCSTAAAAMTWSTVAAAAT